MTRTPLSWATAVWLVAASAALGQPPPDAGPSRSAGPDAAGPDAAGPDAAGPDVAGPDVAGPDVRPPAGTGGAGDPLARSERAYLAVDFAAVRAETRAAIERGGYDVPDLARIYELRGIAFAALGDTEAARNVFARMLAVDPTSRLSPDLAPRLRAPFLEARGAWSARRRQLGAELVWSTSTRALRVSVSDPLGMVDRVELWVRPAGGQQFVMHERPSADEVVVAVDAPHADVYGALLDAHGNRVHAIGSAEQPVRLGWRVGQAVPSSRKSAAVAASIGAAEDPSRSGGGEPNTPGTGDGPVDGEKRSPWRSPWLWVGLGVVLAAGAAGLGLGLRERELELRTDVTADSTP